MPGTISRGVRAPIIREGEEIIYGRFDSVGISAAKQ